MIDGVQIIPLKQFHDERGKVMHMLKVTDDHFMNFGEIYFSCTFPNVVKGWHKHTEMTINYAVVSGAVKVVLFDDRKESKTYGKIQEIFMSPENYSLLIVPPNIWNGFKGVGTTTSIVANCASIAHRSDEIIRLPYNSDKIPYDWNIEFK